MKIRIKGNSLRYRLSKSEVANLRTEGFLEEFTAFGSKTLVYAVVVTDNERLSADFTGEKIVLYMPDKMIDELNTTETVGFDDHTGPVKLLIEKDFACIDNVEEDQTDKYPNPLLACK
ncbi:MAG: hypothetical protein ABWZ25_07435 [Chitinophagaceae bacterium]